MSSTKMNSFYNATKDVFKNMLDIDISELDSSKKGKNGKKVNVSVEFVGDVEGKVDFRFPETTVLNIVKTLSGMEITNVDDFAMSAVGEISNIISGNAATNLSGQQLKCDIKAPQITIENESAATDDNLTIFLQTNAGSLDEQIGLSVKK